MKLIGKLFLLFTISTMVELYLLVQLTHYTNIWVTIATTMISGMLGAYLAKREGLRALAQFRAALSFEQEPTAAIVDGAMLLVAAAFLITPGVLTDLAGLLLLIPTIRRPVGRYLQRRLMKALKRQLESGRMQFFSGSTLDSDFMRGPFRSQERGDVIDIEGKRE